MSRTEWLELDGKRVPEEEVMRISEFHCDHCQLPVAEPVIIQAQVFPGRGAAFGLPQIHLHENCVPLEIARPMRAQGWKEAT